MSQGDTKVSVSGGHLSGFLKETLRLTSQGDNKVDVSRIH